MGTRRIAILSNVTVGVIALRLKKNFNVYTPAGYDTWASEIFQHSSLLYHQKFDAIFVILDGIVARKWESEVQAIETIQEWENYIEILGEEIRCPIFVSTLALFENQIKTFTERSWRRKLELHWYQHVQKLSEHSDHIYFLDIEQLIRQIGVSNFYSNKMWYMGGIPYSKEGIDKICDEIILAMEALYGERRKAIALDLDNTLWGGVIGEDGINGIILSDHREGQRYFDLQRQLVEMKKRGVLLTILSKNNKTEAMEVIEYHPNMLLRYDDFVASRINWDPKSKNYQEIKQELNLTDGSFVFLDDNPVEREAMKEEAPDVIVLDFPIDSSELVNFAVDYYKKYFRCISSVDEDANKTSMYKAEHKRLAEKKKALTTEDYLSKLKLKVQIHPVNESEIERVAQLCGKTNQFNLTTIRYSVQDIELMRENPMYHIYTAHMQDKYGDSGLVSVLILHGLENEGAEIDTFLMSCRVMGRKLENVFINCLIEAYKDCFKYFKAVYIRTMKNKPVESMYENLGFELIEQDEDRKIYKIELKQKLAIQHYYDEVEFER